MAIGLLLQGLLALFKTSHASGMALLQAGNMSSVLKLDGVLLGAEPLQAAITAGPVSLPRCTLSGPDLAGCMAGTACSFSIVSKDAFGNVRIGAADAFIALSQNASMVTVVAAENGVYSVSLGILSSHF